MTAAQDSRAQFEAWARSYGTWEVVRDDDPQLGTTGYTDVALTVAFHAVQASRAALSAEPVASVYTMEALVPGGREVPHVTLHKPLPAGTKLYAAPQAVAVPQGWTLGQPITEEMHVATVKVLRRASGLDGTPQRILDAMLAAARQPRAFQTADGAAQERKPTPATRDCTRPECMSHGCFGHCMRKAPST